MNERDHTGDEATETPGARFERAFIQRMREAREQHGMSQAALVKRLREEYELKIDATAITRIEGGTRSVRLNEAAAIAEILKRSLPQMLAPERALEEKAAELRDEVRRSEMQVDLAHARHRQLLDRLAELEVQIRRKREEEAAREALQQAEEQFREAQKRLEETRVNDKEMSLKAMTERYDELKTMESVLMERMRDFEDKRRRLSAMQTGE